jgi:hypothetical protein
MYYLGGKFEFFHTLPPAARIGPKLLRMRKCYTASVKLVAVEFFLFFIFVCNYSTLPSVLMPMSVFCFRLQKKKKKKIQID